MLGLLVSTVSGTQFICSVAVRSVSPVVSNISPTRSWIPRPINRNASAAVRDGRTVAARGRRERSQVCGRLMGLALPSRAVCAAVSRWLVGGWAWRVCGHGRDPAGLAARPAVRQRASGSGAGRSGDEADGAATGGSRGPRRVRRSRPARAGVGTGRGGREFRCDEPVGGGAVPAGADRPAGGRVEPRAVRAPARGGRGGRAGGRALRRRRLAG